MEKTKAKTGKTPEKLYKDGYAAFEKGNYRKAIELAGACLQSADNDSYWYHGALALRCWSATWMADNERAIRDAYILMSIDSGDDKMWFDGAALLNIGLLLRRNGDNEQAGFLFQFASERYAAYTIASDQPAEWSLIRDMFAAACWWAARGETDKLETLAGTLKKSPAADESMAHVKRAVDLYLRAAAGEDIRADAAAAVSKGVSRTFVALLLV